MIIAFNGKRSMIYITLNCFENCNNDGYVNPKLKCFHNFPSTRSIIQLLISSAPQAK